MAGSEPSGALATGGEAKPRSTRSAFARWMIMLFVFVGLAGMAILYTNTRPPSYSSDAVVTFRPRPEEVNGRDLTSLLVQSYPELVASPGSVSSAAKAAGVSTAELQAGLNTEIAPQTLNLLISVALGTPDQAKTATQHLMDLAVAAGERDPFLEPVPVARADLADSPVGLPRILLNALAVILAAAVAGLVGVLLTQQRRQAD